MTNAELCLIEITEAKIKYGFGPQEDILKHVGEQTAHRHFGGKLIGGSQIGYDLISETGYRRNAKARWSSGINRNGNPKLSRAMKTGKTGINDTDALTLITLCPLTGKVIGMYDFKSEDIKEYCTLDSYDNKQEISTAKVWKYRTVIYER